MRVLLLGTAAGGGLPQWNCTCPNCLGGLPARTQDSLAVSADGTEWLLFNASPDLRAQFLATPALAPPPGSRKVPVGGVVLTDGELDHTLGLLTLREGGGLPVWAPDTVLAALRRDFPAQAILSGYGDWRWRPARTGTEIGGLRLTVLSAGTKRPKYASPSSPHPQDGPWTVAYRIEDPRTGRALVYAPCLPAWPAGFDELAAGADQVLVDGTFYSPDELSTATAQSVHHGAQARMGHLPIAGEDGSLRRISRHRAEHPGVSWVYVHLNNTNPVLAPGSAAHREVRDAGVDIPPDGTEFTL